MRFRRICCLLLIGALLTGGACFGEENGKSFVMAGLDSTQYRSWQNNLFFARMEEKTGVHFELRQYGDADTWTKTKAAMTKDAADLPDVLFMAALTGSECIQMRQNGVLIDLKPYLEADCPNLWALLQKYPEALSAITLPDGSIAALPFISVPSMENYMWINTEWLSTLHLSQPTTAQELVDVLTAFKERDPNRNGRQDEIPLGFLGPFDLKFLAHAFGLICNDYNVFAEDGQVKFMPLEENFRLFVTWCRDLYSAGLLDKNGFLTTDELRRVTDSKATPTYGMILTRIAADLFKVTWSENYEIMMPLTYEGKQVYRSFSGPALRGTFAITAKCADPETVLKWVDYLYSEEGAVLASAGQENVDYLVDGDGTWRFVDSVQNRYEFFAAETLIDGSTEHPGVIAQDFQKRISGGAAVQKVLDGQERFAGYAVMPFPYYTLTAEQEQKIAPLQAQIGYYVDMQIARWVLGEEEISDQSFAAFEEKLKEMDIDGFLAFWQEILNQR